MNKTPIITLRGISKHFPRMKGGCLALDRVNLTIEAGEIFGVVGQSGAGKSTLLRCINFLEVPDEGEVDVMGQVLQSLDRRALSQARQQMGMIFQHFNLLSLRTVYQNVALPLEIAGVDAASIEAKVMPLLKLTGLVDKAEARPAELSGGQKQRVAIARALVLGSKILLCDEATSALDPKTTAEILALLETVRETLGVTIVLITHQMEVIKQICDRVAVMDQGKVIEVDETGPLFTAPKTPQAQQLVHASLQEKLPSVIEAKIVLEAKQGYVPVLRLWFLQGSAADPIITLLIKTFGLDVNILQANIEYVGHHAMGIMLMTLSGEAGQQDKAMAALKEKGVKIEVIGYVPDTTVVITGGHR